MNNEQYLELLRIIGIFFIIIGFISALYGIFGRINMYYGPTDGNLKSAGLLGPSLVLSGSLFLYGFLHVK